MEVLESNLTKAITSQCSRITGNPEALFCLKRTLLGNMQANEGATRPFMELHGDEESKKVYTNQTNGSRVRKLTLGRKLVSTLVSQTYTIGNYLALNGPRQNVLLWSRD